MNVNFFEDNKTNPIVNKLQKKTLNHAIKIYMGVAFGEGILLYIIICFVKLIYRLFFTFSHLN